MFRFHRIPKYLLSLHEYQTAEFFKSFQLPIPPGRICKSAEEAYKAAIKIIQEGAEKNSFTDVVVKAQVHTGGRGKGYFKENGFNSGIHIASTPEDVRDYASKMLGNTLITKQTGSLGKKCEMVYVVERNFLRKELYLSILLDRNTGGLGIVASEKGGIHIEESDPNYIKKFSIEMPNTVEDIDSSIYESVSKVYKLNPIQKNQMNDILRHMFDIFLQTDATLLEINPLGIDLQGNLIICDQKLNIDDNAQFRQHAIFHMEDVRQKDWKEVEAQKHGLNYIALDGNIGCMVNGAGLAMATMDLIKQYDGSPANFLDVGGKATDQEIVSALKIMDKDPNVEAILVNIFAGIARCDQIVLGLLKGLTVLGMKKPMVLRMKGTKVEEAKKLIEESGFNMMFTEDLDEAAKKAVRMAAILRLAKEANINVNLTS
ncbi:unnamed protein product [Paramecium pentaurelia]|uniref:Succinate--CoA ligase [ADP-forming] subunit beta, mitochondrial n=1 Tax=Paramecium pentaurelia TaxID=43138 RepID=A0A8S1RW17_9CILI|nr:unnamed protein product [Paramecium pentaurelia]